MVVADHFSQDPLFITIHSLYPSCHLVPLLSHVVTACRCCSTQRGWTKAEKQEEQDYISLLHCLDNQRMEKWRKQAGTFHPVCRSIMEASLQIAVTGSSEHLCAWSFWVGHCRCTPLPSLQLGDEKEVEAMCVSQLLSKLLKCFPLQYQRF